MIAILVASIVSAAAMVVLLKVFGTKRKEIDSTSEGEAVYVDAAARREVQQRGLGKMFAFK